MYKIIGGDQKEYGPVSADQLRAWIAEGRVNAQTRVQPDGSTDWVALGTLPEFTGSFGAKLPPPPPSAFPQGEFGPEVLERDYTLDIGDCVGRAWNLMQQNMGLLIGATAIYFGIELGMAVLGAIPFIGPIFSIANIAVAGPMMGGLYYVIFCAIRKQPATASDVFAGFRIAFASLILGRIVPGILAALCLIPAVIVMLAAMLPAIIQNQKEPPVAGIIISVAAFLVCLIPMAFLQVNWIFTEPLIADRRMDFWPAMQTSWKMVRKHWWQVFALLIVIAIINVVGVLLCCVGTIFTMPLGMAALLFAYETIFSPRNTPSA